ncbi:hypothetical protein CLOM_g8817 [Closterium sp. NIES-68]|nr:hypothetical protein CLOM_g8817 [Closterium sp. NIES-68]GJP66229.1 hypothetical protein CLOP_g23128 [Closterium sp. NIES-67]
MQNGEKAMKFYYVGEKGREQLRRYKYQGADHSLVSKYILQPFWSRFVLLFPLSAPGSSLAHSTPLPAAAPAPPHIESPCLLCPRPSEITIMGLCFVFHNITFMGLCFVFLSVAISWYTSPDLLAHVPRPVIILFSLLLFLYQTFDAVDGKQARRTGSSSPLGELMDHSCDAVCCTLEVLPFAAAGMMGSHAPLFWLVSSSTFYFASWETFFTHSLVLPIVNGPTEGLLTLCSFFLFTAYVGQEWWGVPLFSASSAIHMHAHMPLLERIASLSRLDLLLLVQFPLFVTPTAVSNLMTVLRAVRSAEKEKRKGGQPLRFSDTTLFAALLLLPYFALSGFTVSWAVLSPSAIFPRHAHFFFLALCFSFALMVGRMILAHLTRESEGLLPSMLQPLLFLTIALINAAWPHLTRGTSPGPLQAPLPELPLLLLYVAHTGYLYGHFAVCVCYDICNTLGIYTFRVGKAKTYQPLRAGKQEARIQFRPKVL